MPVANTATTLGHWQTLHTQSTRMPSEIWCRCCLILTQFEPVIYKITHIPIRVNTRIKNEVKLSICLSFKVFNQQKKKRLANNNSCFCFINRPRNDINVPNFSWSLYSTFHDKLKENNDTPHFGMLLHINKVYNMVIFKK